MPGPSDSRLDLQPPGPELGGPELGGPTREKG